MTDWNATLEAVEKASDGPVVGRSGAMLHAAIFDAVNAIERRYRPCHVLTSAPQGISAPVAADYAAFTVLTALYPGQRALLKRRLMQSLQQLHLPERSRAHREGRAWGKTVARQILAWRDADGFAKPVKPFYGRRLPGQ